MAIQTITARVEDIDEANDRFLLYVNSIGYHVSISQFRELMNGALQLEPVHLIRNAAIKAALSGADPNDMASIKAAVESGGFKI